MPSDRFYIGPPDSNSGQQTNVRPYLIPDEAFESLNNAYVFRGRVRKRFGSKLLASSAFPPSDVAPQLNSRLRINIGVTGAGAINLPNPNPALDIGQMFSVGDDIFTINILGPGVQTLSTNAGATATINSVANPNTVTFTGEPAGTAVYWYPSLPVMGLITYETALINDEPVYAFDTRYAYQFVNGAWSRLGTATWSGNNAQFFWGATYRGVFTSDRYLFVTNYNAADLMKYWTGAAWANFSPEFQPGLTIQTCRMIIPFKGRLLLLNTIENGTTYANRCRYSVNGDPTLATAFYDVPTNTGFGGYIDNLQTQEAIIGARFIKDRLIVFFERSTYELVYTGNEIVPFVWQELNEELGAESTFSLIPFDKFILGVANVGIHACNGANVERIDDKIPDTVFNIHNGNDGVFRVYGIRDYFTELAYWAFPSSEGNPTFPNRVLVYNYKNGTWAFNDDSITCFGYFQNDDDLTWQVITTTWQEMSQTWGGAELQSKFRYVIAGNQQGYTFLVDSNIARNAPSLQITDMTTAGILTVINHNLVEGDFVLIEKAVGLTTYNDRIFKVINVVGNTFSINDPNGVGSYLGGGTLARVSKIDILTKQYNFYAKEGRNSSINKVDFMVDKTENGEISIDYYASSTNLSLVAQGLATGAIVGTSILETKPYPVNLAPLEQQQTRLWHTVYTQVEGEYLQFRFYLNDLQMTTRNISLSDFELHGFIVHTNRTSYRLQ